ncbi:MAG TPA: LicD family protein [Candidatus Treponema faecavium]|nr:LicD family protein [Candidatus Treponema faecavium]
MKRIFNTGETAEQLKQEYNPEGSTLRKAQMRMLDMLLFLDKVCTANNIPYFLSDGNLLGAVRHGGFIPWDDDMDIVVMQKDCKKLVPLLLQATQDTPYILQCHETDHNYKQFWYVLRDTQSEYIQDSPIHKIRKYRGLQVDIFPYSDNVIPVFKKISWRVVRLCNRMIQNDHLKIAEYLYKINRYCLIPLFTFIGLFKIKRDTITYAYTTQWNTQFKKSEIFPLSKITFEGKAIAAPKNPDYVLQTTFGLNYLDLPAKENRNAHQTKIVFYQ